MCQDTTDGVLTASRPSSVGQAMEARLQHHLDEVEIIRNGLKVLPKEILAMTHEQARMAGMYF